MLQLKENFCSSYNRVFHNFTALCKKERSSQIFCNWEGRDGLSVWLYNDVLQNDDIITPRSLKFWTISMFKPDEERASNTIGTLRKDIRISLVLDILSRMSL